MIIKPEQDQNQPLKSFKTQVDERIVSLGIDYMNSDYKGSFKSYLKDVQAQIELEDRSSSIDFEAATRATALTLDVMTNKEVLAHLTEKKSYFTKSELLQAVAGDRGARDRVNALLNSDDIVPVDNRASDSLVKLNPRLAGNEVFTSKEIVRDEIQLAEKTAGLARKTYGLSDDPFTLADLDDKIRVIEQQKSYDLGKPFAFRTDQKDVIKKVLTGNQIDFIQAPAGTGKTTTAQGFADIFKQNGYKVVGMAVSNKAVEQLAADVGLTKNQNAFTIAKFEIDLLREPHNRQIKIDNKTVILVDEASMPSFESYKRLVSEAEKTGAKLVMQGDAKQLPSINRGAVFSEYQTRGLVKPYALTEITRQRNEQHKEAVNAAYKGDFQKAINIFKNDITRAKSDDGKIQAAVAEYLNDSLKPEQKLVLASKIADVDALNAGIRDGLIARHDVYSGEEFTVRVDEAELKTIEIGVGDRLIATDRVMAGREELLSKSEVVTVTGIDDGIMSLKKADGFTVKVDMSKKPGLDYAYALTVHKSQGQTVDKCIVVDSSFMTSELGYVAMSRHRDELKIFTTATNEALAQKMSVSMTNFNAENLVTADVIAEVRRDLTMPAKIQKHTEKFGAVTAFTPLTPLSEIEQHLAKGVVRDLGETGKEAQERFDNKAMEINAKPWKQPEQHVFQQDLVRGNSLARELVDTDKMDGRELHAWTAAKASAVRAQINADPKIGFYQRDIEFADRYREATGQSPEGAFYGPGKPNGPYHGSPDHTKALVLAAEEQKAKFKASPQGRAIESAHAAVQRQNELNRFTPQQCKEEALAKGFATFEAYDQHCKEDYAKRLHEATWHLRTDVSEIRARGQRIRDLEKQGLSKSEAIQKTEKTTEADVKAPVVAPEIKVVEAEVKAAELAPEIVLAKEEVKATSVEVKKEAEVRKELNTTEMLRQVAFTVKMAEIGMVQTLEKAAEGNTEETQNDIVNNIENDIQNNINNDIVDGEEYETNGDTQYDYDSEIDPVVVEEVQAKEPEPEIAFELPKELVLEKQEATQEKDDEKEEDQVGVQALEVEPEEQEEFSDDLKTVREEQAQMQQKLDALSAKQEQLLKMQADLAKMMSENNEALKELAGDVVANMQREQEILAKREEANKPAVEPVQAEPEQEPQAPSIYNQSIADAERNVERTERFTRTEQLELDRYKQELGETKELLRDREKERDDLERNKGFFSFNGGKLDKLDKDIQGLTAKKESLEDNVQHFEKSTEYQRMVERQAREDLEMTKKLQANPGDVSVKKEAHDLSNAHQKEDMNFNESYKARKEAERVAEEEKKKQAEEERKRQRQEQQGLSKLAPGGMVLSKPGR